jgi:hypothetical protein
MQSIKTTSTSQSGLSILTVVIILGFMTLSVFIVMQYFRYIISSANLNRLNLETTALEQMIGEELSCFKTLGLSAVCGGELVTLKNKLGDSLDEITPFDSYALTATCITVAGKKTLQIQSNVSFNNPLTHQVSPYRMLFQMSGSAPCNKHLNIGRRLTVVSGNPSGGSGVCLGTLDTYFPGTYNVDFPPSGPWCGYAVNLKCPTGYVAASIGTDCAYLLGTKKKGLILAMSTAGQGATVSCLAPKNLTPYKAYAICIRE